MFLFSLHRLICFNVTTATTFNHHYHSPTTITITTHRQSIDVIAWHPAGHCVGTASHDGILKFWSREPPGSTLEQEAKEFQDNPVFAHGPLEVID